MCTWIPEQLFQRKKCIYLAKLLASAHSKYAQNLLQPPQFWLNPTFFCCKKHTAPNKFSRLCTFKSSFIFPFYHTAPCTCFILSQLIVTSSQTGYCIIVLKDPLNNRRYVQFITWYTDYKSFQSKDHSGSLFVISMRGNHRAHITAT